MIVSSLFYTFILNLKNIPGWHTSRKIVVIECDDWGGIRIPSTEVYNKLVKAGVGVTKSHFRYDTLESAEDLSALFEVLIGVKDRNGRGAVMTAVTSMANPDFEKIRDSGFKNYYYEKFTDTLLRYGRGLEVMNLWKQGVTSGIFLPELHGREHIAVHFWLEKLREGNMELIKAFDYKVVSIEIPGLIPLLQEFRPEFFFISEQQKEALINSIKDSATIFEETFGFKAKVFVPANGIFHPDFESTVAETGVRYLNVDHLRFIPDNNGGLKRSFCITGQKSGGLRLYIRNCAFEPSSESYSGIELTLKQVEAAFRWRKPAIISTHRVNFVGGISSENRKKGLKELSAVLKALIRYWPDIEFMGSSEALNTMSRTNI